MSKTIHVSNEKGRWVVKKDRENKEVSSHRDKKEAITKALRIAGSESDVYIHGRESHSNPSHHAPHDNGPERVIGRDSLSGQFTKVRTSGVGSFDGDPLPPRIKKPKPKKR